MNTKYKLDDILDGNYPDYPDKILNVVPCTTISDTQIELNDTECSRVLYAPKHGTDGEYYYSKRF